MIDQNLENAFLRGNLFPNLYSFYKYEPKNFINCCFDNTLYLLALYNFYTVELSLYLAVNPGDLDAKELLKKANLDLLKLEKLAGENIGISKNDLNVDGYLNLELPWSDKRVGV